MQALPAVRGGRRRTRRRSVSRQVGAGLGCLLFSPLALMHEVVTRRRQLASAWVRGFLLLGLVLLAALAMAILAVQDADHQVFAALGSFGIDPETVPAARPYAAEINAAASRYGLNPLMVSYVVQIESGGDPNRVSPRGARGLMQIMPETWCELNPRGSCRGGHVPSICAAGDDCIFAPWGNIRTGTLYLSRLLRSYRGDYLAALQAYNAGGQHVVDTPAAKYAETRRYLKSFLRLFQRKQQVQLQDQMAAAVAARRWVRPLLYALAGHAFLGVAFFWRRHRWAP